jgi:hypothetical protein
MNVYTTRALVKSQLGGGGGGDDIGPSLLALLAGPRSAFCVARSKNASRSHQKSFLFLKQKSTANGEVHIS